MTRRISMQRSAREIISVNLPVLSFRFGRLRGFCWQVNPGPSHVVQADLA